MKSVPLFVSDTQSHLIGTHIFIKAQQQTICEGGLGQAAFLVGLRQQIYMALIKQEPVGPEFDLPCVERSLAPADDCTWANRIISHCSHVLRFCFGDDQSDLEARHHQLLEYGRRWQDCLPASFMPVYREDADAENGRVLPKIW